MQEEKNYINQHKKKQKTPHWSVVKAVFAGLENV